MPDAVLEIMVNKGMFEYFHIITVRPGNGNVGVTIQVTVSYKEG